MKERRAKVGTNHLCRDVSSSVMNDTTSVPSEVVVQKGAPAEEHKEQFEGCHVEHQRSR